MLDLPVSDDTSVDDDFFMKEVDRGMKGLNIGLYNSMARGNIYLHGMHRRYYLIGADSGVGKTTFSDQYYVLEPILYAIKAGIPVHFFYHSFEVSLMEKIARWISWLISEMWPDIWLSPDYILGRIKETPVTVEHRELIKSARKFIKDHIEPRITFMDHAVHPTHVFEEIITKVEEKKWITVHRTVSKDKSKKGFVKSGTYQDSQMMIFNYIDHLALGMSEQGLNTKETIDRFSRQAVTLRNALGIGSVFLQQFNPEMQSTYTQAMSRKGTPSIKPTRGDFGDSKFTYRDADVVWGLVNPAKFDMANWGPYNLSPDHLGNNLLLSFLMKNRYGSDNRVLPMFINGVTGHITELPLDPLTSPFEMQKFYSLTKKIEEVCQSFSLANPSSSVPLTQVNS